MLAPPPPHGPVAIAYRPDIDGLRAIAVLAVVLFHSGLPGLPGGFIGVDVFFVISGYLIGGQIHREQLAGSFSLAAFYARRVRRILPALIALLATLTAIGWLVLTPIEYRQFGKEMVAAVVGGANLLFYLGGGYFEPAAERSPLLMTWSLGVEEQFYLLFPFVLIAIARLRRGSAGSWLLLLSVLSFAASLWLIRVDAKAAFYLLPTRAWELGMGAALAVIEYDRGRARLPQAAIVGMLALAALAAAILFYRPEIPFPGLYALVPVLATVLLIATPQSWVNRRLLGNRLMRGIGLISYSWYLWHWPVFYLNRLLADPERGVHPVGLLILSLALAFSSWRWVEQPLRRRVLAQPAVLWRYAGAVVLTTMAGAALFLADGVPGRLPPAAAGAARAVEAARQSPCLAPFAATAPDRSAACRTPGGRDRLVLLGDSHASSIAPGLARLAARSGLGFAEMTKSSCLPLIGAGRPTPGRPGYEPVCRRFQQTVFAEVLRDPAIRVVALAGYWDNGAFAEDETGRAVPLADALRTTVRRLESAGKRVLLVQDVPMFAFDPYARVIGGQLPLRRALAQWVAGEARSDHLAGPDQRLPDRARPMIARIAGNRTLIDPVAGLCVGRQCRYGLGAQPYYSDFQHLTPQGAAAALATIPPIAPSDATTGAAPRGQWNQNARSASRPGIGRTMIVDPGSRI